MGIIALIGPKNTLLFFAKKTKILGSGFYFIGLLMIIIGWYMFTFLGFLAQMYGLFLLFRSFLTTILVYAQTLPVIGPFLRSSSVLHKTVKALEVKEGKRKKAKFEV
jgi:hypothetical protein